MVKYILKRLVQLVVVLLGVTFLTFMITQAAPSDAGGDEICFHGHDAVIRAA